MKAIKYINSEDIISIDIETVRVVKDYKDLSDNKKMAWQYKHKQDGVVPKDKELSDLWIKTASQYPEFSKVCSVAIVYLSKEELKCKQYTSEYEFLILKELSEDLNKFKKFNPKFRLIGHASKFYDFPFLCKRYIINSMDIPLILDESDAKPWEQTLLCTNELWKSFGAFNNHGSSLLSLCVALDLEISKCDLAGDEVGNAYYKGELVEIGDYCCLDTIATYNVFRRFKQENTFLFSEVKYVNKGEVLTLDTKVKESKGKLLDLIFESGKITPKQSKELLEKAKDLTKDEVLGLITIIKAIFKGDLSNKTVKETVDKLETATG